MHGDCLGRRLVIGLLIAGLANPTLAASPSKDAAANSKDRPTAIDVVLTNDGLLAGQLVDPAGNAIEGAAIWLHTPSAPPVKAMTNGRGQFAYRGVPGGVVVVQAGAEAKLTRVWARHTAPPKVQSGVLMVAKRDVLRGQIGPNPGANALVGRSKRFFANPIALAATIGAAVAIPVAIHNSDSES